MNKKELKNLIRNLVEESMSSKNLITENELFELAQDAARHKVEDLLEVKTDLDLDWDDDSNTNVTYIYDIDSEETLLYILTATTSEDSTDSFPNSITMDLITNAFVDIDDEILEELDFQGAVYNGELDVDDYKFIIKQLSQIETETTNGINDLNDALKQVATHVIVVDTEANTIDDSTAEDILTGRD